MCNAQSDKDKLYSFNFKFRHKIFSYISNYTGKQTPIDKYKFIEMTVSRGSSCETTTSSCNLVRI